MRKNKEGKLVIPDPDFPAALSVFKNNHEALVQKLSKDEQVYPLKLIRQLVDTDPLSQFILEAIKESKLSSSLRGAFILLITNNVTDIDKIAAFFNTVYDEANKDVIISLGNKLRESNYDTLGIILKMLEKRNEDDKLGEMVNRLNPDEKSLSNDPGIVQCKELLNKNLKSGSELICTIRRIYHKKLEDLVFSLIVPIDLLEKQKTEDNEDEENNKDKNDASIHKKLEGI